MPTFAKVCDIYQGYNYKKDQQTTFGFITALQIGDTTFTADQTCTDPVAASEVKVVAVLSNFLWSTGITDAVYFAGQVSTTSRQNIALLTITDMVKVNCVFQFSVFEFDPVAQQYFLTVTSNNTAMNGILEKNGSDLNLSVADDSSPEVQSPLNFAFQIGIKPQPSAQTLNIATSTSNKVVKSWGLTVGS